MSKANLLVGLVLSLCCAVAFAQGSDPTARKVTVSLQTGVPETAPGGKTDRNSPSPVMKSVNGNSLISVTIVAVEPLAGKPPPHRLIDYSEDQLVFVGLADDGAELTRSVMIDPRLIRAEAILGENDLQSTRLYRQSVNFSVTLDDPAVARMRILKPRWTGGEWHFDVIAETPL